MFNSPQINNEIPCPQCGKLIALFEKPANPLRLVGACNCIGHLREVIELDNPVRVEDLKTIEPFSFDPSAENQRKRSKK